jgi:hypothetical protein
VERNGAACDRTDYAFVSGLTISADSIHVAYAGAQNLAWDVVLDGVAVTGKAAERVEFRGWDDISKSTPAISPDGAHVAFGCSRDGRWHANLDGRPIGDPFFGFAPGGIAFSHDSQHIGYAGATKGGWFAAVDEKHGSIYPTISQRSWGFSPDSSKFAYVAGLQGQWIGDQFTGESCVVVNDTPGQAWRTAAGSGLFEEIAFSPDSNRHAYWVTQSGKGFFVVDGRREPLSGAMVSGWIADPEWKKRPHTNRVESRAQPITFSPDSSHYIYAISTGEECLIVRDGEAIVSQWKIGNQPIVYSADSKHYAYVVGSRSGDNQAVWVDGVEMMGRHFRVAAIPLVFSPSGNRLAYVARSGSSYEICINRNSHVVFGEPPSGARPVWIDNDHVQLMSESHLELVLETFRATPDSGTF